MPLCIADRTLHFSLILGPRKILRAGWKKSCRSVPYSIFGLMARKRQSENAPKAGNLAKSTVSHYTFSELKNSVGLVHLLSFFCDFCCQYSSEFAASFQLCQFSKLQMRSFELLLLIETQRSSCSNCGAGMPLFSENIMNMTASHGVFHFRHNDVCALDSLRTVRRPSVPKCAKFSTMCF